VGFVKICEKRGERGNGLYLRDHASAHSYLLLVEQTPYLAILLHSFKKRAGGNNENLREKKCRGHY